MKKLLSVFTFSFVLIGLFNLTGCATSNWWHRGAKPPVMLTQKYGSLRFNQLTIIGPVNVIVTQGKQQTLTLLGDQETLGKYVVHNGRHGLLVQAPADRPYCSTVYITASFLQKMRLGLGVLLKANKLEVLNLQVVGQGRSDIDVKGQIFAARVEIEQQGQGKIAFSWLASDKVTVRSNKNGVIYLAGQSYRLFADLSDHAYLDAKYLRTNQVMVQAEDSARADVLPLDSLRASTIDSSIVGYYHRPSDFKIDSQDSSNVLFLPGAH
ncbi:MAG: hypothetical protein A2X78_01125 [Gammaproteobacteria bacterium GWE2_37_16]|nr:MAG: hypothetical protein A2X78_01125 [Gammaproteobacteria bacterium GWE2_37_16]